jgi:outer membrane protein OmpA-like peptidoglycan-associated protein
MPYTKIRPVSACPGNSGYIFPLILFATLAVGLFILTLTQYQSANRVKFQHLNDYQAAFNIAYSALVEVLADIQSKQWSNRSFKSGPKDKSASLFGGSFDLRVADHDASQYLFNVKTRVSYKNRKHLFYWRMKYNPNLLDFTSLFLPVCYEDLQDSITATPGEIDKMIDKILETREENLEKATEIAQTLKTAPTIKEALKKIGINSDKVNGADTPRPEPPSFVPPTENLTLKNLEKLAKDVDADLTFVVKNFHFGGDVSELTEAQKDLLDALAEILRTRPSITVELRGHTTGVVGTEESNVVFSVERAQNIADYLVNAGIAASRLTVKGFGAQKPIAGNDTEAGKAKNRRVEFILSSSGN